MKFEWKRRIAVFCLVVAIGLAGFAIQAFAVDQVDSDPVVADIVETPKESKGTDKPDEPTVPTESTPPTESEASDGHENAQAAPKATNRSVTVEWIMNKDILTTKDKFTMEAKLKGFEKDDKIKVQWQYFVEGKGKREGKWENVKKGGNALIYEFQATKENLWRQWRVTVTVQ